MAHIEWIIHIYTRSTQQTHQLGEDLVLYNSLCQVITVVGQASQGQSSRLLNAVHVKEVFSLVDDPVC